MLRGLLHKSLGNITNQTYVNHTLRFRFVSSKSFNILSRLTRNTNIIRCEKCNLLVNSNGYYLFKQPIYINPNYLMSKVQQYLKQLDLQKNKCSTPSLLKLDFDAASFIPATLDGPIIRVLIKNIIIILLV
jgi:hypothetical protein